MGEGGGAQDIQGNEAAVTSGQQLSWQRQLENKEPTVIIWKCFILLYCSFVVFNNLQVIGFISEWNSHLVAVLGSVKEWSFKHLLLYALIQALSDCVCVCVCACLCVEQMVYLLATNGANNIWEHTMLDPSQNRHGRKKPGPRDPLQYAWLSFHLN